MVARKRSHQVTPFTVVPYDKRIHSGFVFSTFLSSVREGWPWGMMEERRLRADLTLRLREKRPGCVAAVAHVEGDPSELMGWAACVPLTNEIVYAYTKESYRTAEAALSDTREMVKRFEPRVASTLVTKLGVDLTKKTSLRYWTPCAETIDKRGGYLLRPTKESR